ncbi:MAG: hypothetical protein HeimC2_20870 [Candidatus Heimdallarchaeota archaeon LC_2]|nr:MAG: hypothetical protein HeimC2_20870 [Candidatus Heimdallarchaeota archaeon LC_2]
MVTAFDLMLRMLKADANSFRAEVNAINLMPTAMQPAFEGTDDMMEEGMVYIMFNSVPGRPIDSVWRIFFVNIPAMGWCEIDVFLISERLPSYHWSESFFDHFRNLSPNKFHQEFSNNKISFVIDGTWQQGYKFEFVDIQNGCFANITFEKLSRNHVLVYANGKFLTTHRVSLKAYDMFGVKAKGSFKYRNQVFNLQAANDRGLIEHGLGIYLGVPTVISTWFNLHFGDNSIKVFVYELKLPGGNVEFGEAALMINGVWKHFLFKHINLKILAWAPDPNIIVDIPVRWRLSMGYNRNRDDVIKISIKRTAHLAWDTFDHYVIDYVLGAKIRYERNRFKAKGTMEVVIGHDIW